LRTTETHPDEDSPCGQGQTNRKNKNGFQGKARAGAHKNAKPGCRSGASRHQLVIPGRRGNLFYIVMQR
jgi:hypothetical protein